MLPLKSCFGSWIRRPKSPRRRWLLVAIVTALLALPTLASATIVSTTATFYLGEANSRRPL